VEAALVAADKRTIFAAPFPYNATMEQLTAFFERQGPVACVRLRRHLESKDFRGSVFVEFGSEETADKVRGAATSVT
jgi:lupus La protein